MQLCLLHLDDALKRQPGFLATSDAQDALKADMAHDAAEIRLWGKQVALQRLHSSLKEKVFLHSEPHLCFMGSGDFHHVTALLLDLTLKQSTQPITVLHFDNHPDWVHFASGMHCGSWINRALEHPLVSKIITIGVCSGDLRNPGWKGANLSQLTQGKLELFPYAHPPSRVPDGLGSGPGHWQQGRKLHWNNIADLGEPEFIETLLRRIQTDQVYITVDKDVLNREDAETNWDQGQMRLPFLLEMIRRVGQRHRMVGADVTGDYSVPRYSGSLWARASKRAEILMDQPQAWHASSRRRHAADLLNEATNHALLQTFSQVMA